MNLDQLAPGEPISPELVLVLSPKLRAQVLASLGPPVWPTPRPRVAARQTSLDEPFGRSLGQIVVARVIQLGVIFVAITAFTLAMSLAAHAFR
jgi:hypothetical protein